MTLKQVPILEPYTALYPTASKCHWKWCRGSERAPRDSEAEEQRQRRQRRSRSHSPAQQLPAPPPRELPPPPAREEKDAQLAAGSRNGAVAVEMVEAVKEEQGVDDAERSQLKAAKKAAKKEKKVRAAFRH